MRRSRKNRKKLWRFDGRSRPIKPPRHARPRGRAVSLEVQRAVIPSATDLRTAAVCRAQIGWRTRIPTKSGRGVECGGGDAWRVTGYMYCGVRRTGRYYVGQRRELMDRLARHNAGRCPATRGGIPWAVIWREAHATRASAMARERTIKGWKSRRMLERLAESNAPTPLEGEGPRAESGRKSP